MRTLGVFRVADVRLAFAVFFFVQLVVSKHNSAGVSMQALMDRLVSIKEHLQRTRILETAELHERFARITQLEFQSSRFHQSDLFYDRHPLNALSTLYIALDAENVWSRWSRVFDATLTKKTTILHRSLELSPSSAGAIEAVGRDYDSNNLAPSSLLLIKNRRFPNGFLCTRLRLYGHRQQTTPGAFPSKPEVTSAGIAFGYDEEHGGSYWAAMIDNASQMIVLTQREASRGTVVKIHQQPVRMGIVPLRVYTLAVEWIGAAIHVYLDGQSVLSVQREQPAFAGMLGLAVGQGRAQFYNVFGGPPLHRHHAPRYCFSSVTESF